jgi:hypothetical protein
MLFHLIEKDLILHHRDEPKLREWPFSIIEGREDFNRCTWLVDSGVLCHMGNSDEGLFDTTLIDEPTTLGNGKTLHAAKSWETSTHCETGQWRDYRYCSGRVQVSAWKHELVCHLAGILETKESMCTLRRNEPQSHCTDSSRQPRVACVVWRFYPAWVKIIAMTMLYPHLKTPKMPTNPHARIEALGHQPTPLGIQSSV